MKLIETSVEERTEGEVIEYLFVLDVCLGLYFSYYFLHALYFRSVLRGLTLSVVEYSSTRLGSSYCCIKALRLVITLQNKLEAVQVPNIKGAECSLYS